MNNDKKISLLFKQYFPSFIKRDYPKYVSFFKGFYEWYESENNPYDISRNLISYRSVDDTLDKYIQYIKKEHMSNIVDTDEMYDKLFLKNIKELYISKGSEASFKFLTRILFGEEATILYPKDFLFKSSDGIYYRQHNILTNIDIIDTSDILFTKIQGVSSSASGVIENILRYNTIYGYVSEFELSNIEGQFLPEEEVKIISPTTNEEYIGNIYNTISNVNIINGGQEYEIGDTFNIPPGAHNGSGFECKVDAINHGYIQNINVIDGGLNYQVGDIIVFDNTNTLDIVSGISAKGYVSSVDGSGTIQTINLIENGYGYYKNPTITISSINGTNADIEIDSYNIGSIKKIDIFKFGINYQDDPSLIIAPLNVSGTNAELNPIIGTIQDVKGMYKENGSFLSDVFKLQDSYLWQDYSYLIQSITPLDESTSTNIQNYRDVFLKLLHPIGLKFFSELLLQYLLDFRTRSDIWLEIGYGENVGDNEKEIELYGEFISYIDRVIDDNIFQNEKIILDSIKTDTLGSFVRSGGDYAYTEIEKQLEQTHNFNLNAEIEVDQS